MRKKFTRFLKPIRKQISMMQHFLNLDKCSCGAYRYLAIREHKRSYEVYLIHHSHSRSSQDSRKYMKLASIPKYKLNIHDDRVNELSQKKVLSLTFEQSIALKTILRELESVENSVVQEGEEDQLDITEQVIAR